MDMMTSSGNTRKTRLRSATNFITRNTVKKASNNRNHGCNAKNQRSCVIRSNSLRNNINNKNAAVPCTKHDNNGNNSMPKNMNVFGRGKFTREVYQAISGRLGHTPHIPGDSVQALFNDMKLYPSKNEVSEMLQCARQVGRRNGTSPYLTFGEFCLFAREMQRPQIRRKPQAHNKPNKCTNNCEVFLGGSCNPTTWRTDTAIPELQKHGITYYNPQVSIWAPELVAQEHDAKQSASLLFFVVDSQTRSVSGMIEVAYLVAVGRCVVLVAHPYRQGQSIMGETITNREYLDLVNGQTSLLALVKSQGIKVYSSLSSALQTTAKILRNSVLNNGMTAEEQVTHKLRKLREAFDSFDGNHTGEINLNDVLDAYYRLTNKSIDMHSLSSYLGINGDTTNVRISFEQFCALVAEFSTDGCESFTTNDGRFTNSIYWTSALLKTRHLLRFYIKRPLTHFIDWLGYPLQRQCSTNNNSHYGSENHIIKNNRNRNGISNLIDVYLGGSCSGKTSWRENVVPLLKKQGITYYNPAIREMEYEVENSVNNSILNGSTIMCGDKTSVCESSVLQWKRAMDKSKVLLFVVTDDTRSLTTMILAAHYIGLDRNVVLCIQQLPVDDFQIENEKLTKQAIKDYNRGRVYLADLAKRKQIPVFDSITDSIQCAIDRSQNR